ncbi:hypothetical protein [Veillonella montpellierensis]|uniref:hypothetical protein n=1 Tax=Veillonella montpellierensis TaxID=187328 RepID=UPI0023F6EA60|nr:hypothetical protein [Veillonella montpellierensis]
MSFIATMDKRTSSVCRNYGNNIYPLYEAEVGSHVLSLHFKCRYTIAGTLGFKKGTSGSCIAQAELTEKGGR